MLYSELTRKESEAEKRPYDFRHSTLGALETLTYAGRPVESLPDFNLKPEVLGQFEVLVLPEVTGAVRDTGGDNSSMGRSRAGH